MANLKNFVKLGKKIVGVGINYKSVVQKMKIPTPEKPIIFLKPTTAYITEGQCIKIPENFTVTQEVELGVVIGRTCYQVRECDAMEYVGGYCLVLDMTSTSELQIAREKGLSWTVGKGFDTSCPVSRFITLNDIKDPHNVELWCKVNGKLRQKANTEDLLFTVPQIISYTSQYITLEANDLIITGTPSGNAPVSRGDIIQAGIKDLISIEFKVE